MLTSRGRATTLREEIENATANGGLVVVDLDGVEIVSPSYADELFGKLAPLVAAGSVRFDHVAPAIEPLARYVVESRSS